MSRDARKGLKVIVSAPGPIPAPIQAGQIVAKLQVNIPGREVIEKPLVAGHEVDSLSGFGRIGKAFNQLLWGENR